MLMDSEEFYHSFDKSHKITIGEFTEKLLAEKSYFNTVLPRIPVLIEREIQKKLL
jgi:hypothetical protein